MPALAAPRGVLLVGVIRRVQVAFANKECDKPLFVRCCQRDIERVLVDRFGHQLTGVADQIGLHLAQPNGLAGEWSEILPLVVELGRFVFVDEDLERHSQFLAVSEVASTILKAGLTLPPGR
jgi:hypothetical protein